MRRKDYWSHFPRRALLVLAFCCVVAAFNSVVWAESGYWEQLVYSLCIGVLIWLTIDAGRLLVPRRHCNPSLHLGAHGWPSGWRGPVLVAASITVGYFGGITLAAWLLDDAIFFMDSPRNATLGLLIAAAVGVVTTSFLYIRDRQAMLHVHVADTERAAAEARLKLLQSQLEPHMLFNTLANLRALIEDKDADTALDMVDRMDDFLRTLLSASRATWHPLAAEFDRLSDYLALLAIRMGSRLRYTLDLPDELRELPVPPLLLQPLVENAIKHGLAPLVEGGEVEVTAARAGDTLALTVRDNGAGFDADQPRPEGHFGLTQVLERVAAVYDGQGRVAVQSAPNAGTTIRISLPCRPPP
jgi:signal transduction histidine kinase